ncbi:hypothetical protein Pfo_003338 [Paulownia fortunei]|nr:hypothetical protein Pfo_003338 [Paulownia fortunei]
MLSSLALPIINGGALLSARQLPSSNFHSSAGFKTRCEIVSSKNKNSSNPGLGKSKYKGKSNKVVVMVDPLEAKRLAARQMEQIKAKEKFKKRRQIEAINGAWAMIGLTAGLVIEGHTGNSILAQLAGYWAALIGFFVG